MSGQYRYSREEEILIIDLYTRTPTSMIKNSNKDIIELCQTLNKFGYGCVVSGIRNKMENLKSVDVEYTADGRVGRLNMAKSFRDLWNGFYKNGFSDLDDAVEKAWSVVNSHIADVSTSAPHKPIREGQQLFRQRVLKAYDCTCCISGMKEISLLDACHIMPYKVCIEKGLSHAAMDVRNGLCMNTLYHKAFDRGLFTIDNDHRVQLSKAIDMEFAGNSVDTYFAPMDGKTISSRTLGNIDERYLEYHRTVTFKT